MKDNSRIQIPGQYGIREDVYETVGSFPIDMVDILLWGQRMTGTPIGVKQNMVKDNEEKFCESAK